MDFIDRELEVIYTLLKEKNAEMDTANMWVNHLVSKMEIEGHMGSENIVEIKPDHPLKTETFACKQCGKTLQLSKRIFDKAYKGHDTCLDCR